LAGAYGVYLLYTSIAFGWRGVGVSPRIGGKRRRGRTLGAWLAESGLDGVQPGEFVAVTAVLFVIGAGVAFALFGGPLPAVARRGAVRRRPGPKGRRGQAGRRPLRPPVHVVRPPRNGLGRSLDRRRAIGI